MGIDLGLPTELNWEIAPAHWRRGDAAELQVTAPAQTDMFVDPAGGDPVVTAPRLVGPAPEGDFQFSARVSVDFTGTYDAGCLLVYAGTRHWAKLAYERSPQGTGMVVSVITREFSDDANGFVVADGAPLWLRISRLGPAWAFHASTDGKWWEFTRHFRLDGAEEPVRIGLEAQAPVGPGCQVRFDRIAVTADRLAELRDGR